MRFFLPLLLVLLLSGTGCSVNIGVERSEKVPFKASYSVTHYRAQQNCEECASYTPSYTNFSTPIQCRYIDECANGTCGRCAAVSPR